MNQYIIAWVLVVAPSTSQNSPIISLPVADIQSCHRMQQALRADSQRITQCVEIKLPAIAVPKT